MNEQEKLKLLRAQLKDMLIFIGVLPIPEGYDNNMYWLGAYPGYPDQYNPGDWKGGQNFDLADEWDMLLGHLKELGMTTQLEVANKLEVADLLHYTAEVWDEEFGMQAHN